MSEQSAESEHECGLYYAERPCCAARAGEPGDFTLGGAVALLFPSGARA